MNSFDHLLKKESLSVLLRGLDSSLSIIGRDLGYLDEWFHFLCSSSLWLLQGFVLIAGWCFLGGKTFVVYDLHVLGFLNYDF